MPSLISPEKLKQLLNDIKNGTVSVDEALSTLSTLPFADIGIAKVDHHRVLRTGFPEVMLGERKDPGAQELLGISSGNQTSISFLVLASDATEAPPCTTGIFAGKAVARAPNTPR